jgi:NAD(P)-dependent dehydrogenase (short-subunit alcohol dehydrogenase family)
MVRRVVVTGAASGIGAALAESLAANGAEVFGLDRSPEMPACVQPVRCDLADPPAVAAAVTELPARIDGLANVAGVPGTAPPELVMAVNILGLRALTEALVARIRPVGAIVQLASMAGYHRSASDAEVAFLLGAPDGEVQTWVAERGMGGPEAYRLSKQLVIRYASEMAARLLTGGVRAASVSPGPVETPILGDFRATMDGVDKATALLGRHGRPGEVAAAVEFLLSPAASWCNGIDLRVDGGLQAARAAPA